MLYQSLMSALYPLSTDQLHLMREHGIIPKGELVELIEGQLYRVPTCDAEHQGAVAKVFGTIDRLLQEDSGDNS